MSGAKTALKKKAVDDAASGSSAVTPAERSKNAKHSMGYEDALVALHDYNEELLNASGLRLRNDVDLELSSRTILKTTVLSILLTFPAGILDYTNTVDALTLAPFAWGGLALFFGGFVGPCFPSFVKVFSPLKVKEQRKQHALTDALIALKEADYKEKKTKILKRADPVLAIVNEKLKENGKEVFLETNNHGGTERFEVRDIGETRSYMSRALHYSEDTKLSILESSPKKQLTA